MSAASLLLVAVPALADFQLSPDDGGSHSYPAVCRPTDGFVAAWESWGDDGRDVVVQRVDDDGRPTGDPITANQTTDGDQQLPDIACRPDGSFVVVWESRGQDGDGLGVFGRSFDATGAPLSGEWAIATTTTDNQRAPRLCIRPDGSTLVVWHSEANDRSSIVARLFDGDTLPLGDELPLNRDDGTRHLEPAVACAADGRSLVVWSGTIGTQPGILGRILLQDGSLDARELLQQLGEAGRPEHPAVASHPRGEFVVAATSRDGKLGTIVVDLPPEGGSSTTVRPDLDYPMRNEAAAIAIDGDGDTIIAWSQGTGFAFDVSGLRVTSVSSDERSSTLNANRTGNDGALSTIGRGIDVAAAADGDIVVWQKRDILADDSRSSIMLRRFRDCAGDCGGDFRVSVNELIVAVRIALGLEEIGACTTIDADGNGEVAITELIRAVNEALASICPAPTD